MIDMKKLTTSVLFAVFSASFVVVQAQEVRRDSVKTKQIEEVVITAMGIKRQDKALGYSVSKVSGDDLSKTGNQNITNALAGKTPGVQVVASGGAPGQASRLVIRGGAKSITGNNEPLYVIDGVPMSNANDGNDGTEGFVSPNRAVDINPDDIESINILRGAAGAVLYGNRGSNGVVVITTKSGKSKGGRPMIEYSSNVSFENALKLPDYQIVYAQGNKGIYREGTSLSWGPKITGQVYNPRKQFLQTGSSRNNNISISHSFNNSSVFLSAGHFLQTSIVPNQEYEKTNFRFNGNTRVTDKLDLGATASYNRTNGNLPFDGQDGSNPFFALFHTPVTWDLKGRGYQTSDGKQINFRGGSFDNPYWAVYNNFAKTKSTRTILGANIGYKFTDWLKLSYRIGNDNLKDNRLIYKDIGSGSAPKGYVSYDDIERNELTSTLMLNIDKNITENLVVTANVGQDYNKRAYTHNIMTGTKLIQKGIVEAYNIAEYDNSPSNHYNSKRTLFGAFADITLNYKNYLFLNLVGRQEWSSTLPKNNRSYFYPGASLSFVFSDAFEINKGIISYGKVRAGVSKTARDAEPYLVNQVYTSASYGDSFTDGVNFPMTLNGNTVVGYSVANTSRNANLKPEFTTEYELGAELKFIRNRIGLDFTYFRNINTNVIIPNLEVSPASGTTKSVVNIGGTKVRGIEVGLNIVPIKSKDFNWELNLNFSKIKSKVVDIAPYERVFMGGFSGNPAIYAIQNERLGSIVGSAYLRDEKGNIVVRKGLPVTVSGQNLGYVEPDWTGSLSTAFKYKGVYLTAQVDVRQGGYIYNGTEMLLDYYGVSEKTMSRNDYTIVQGVTKEGATNTTKVLQNLDYYDALPDEAYVYKNNWVKLREITLGYSFKPRGLSFVRSMDIGVYGRNLALWTKVLHIDPESSSLGTGNAQGVSRMAFPTTRSFGFNFKVQF